jgi:hypothetical protein
VALVWLNNFDFNFNSLTSSIPTTATIVAFTGVFGRSGRHEHDRDAPHRVLLAGSHRWRKWHCSKHRADRDGEKSQ